MLRGFENVIFTYAKEIQITLFSFLTKQEPMRPNLEFVSWPLSE